MTLANFYQIVDHADWLERFLPLGLKLVQLRIKDQPYKYIKEQVKASKALCDEYDCQLVVNDYWQIAIDEGCDFVHLGQEDLVGLDRTCLIKNNIKLGLSTHDHYELQVALAAKPDYIALGPIFPTILKAMKWQPQGVTKIGEWKQLIGDIPLVAIGGLNIVHASSALQAGADSLCVVTDVLRNQNPEQRLQEWLNQASLVR